MTVNYAIECRGCGNAKFRMVEVRGEHDETLDVTETDAPEALEQRSK